ncbi:hypothetical protein, partial [Pseudomonas sp. MPR-R2A7]|uniref:hypothetical protein n=1 Tax=Pseudomonas sp. MPR-R2A7 TaxID=2070618 RepID=UPI001C4537E0
MTDPLTPVLSANWDEERSWKLLNYERQGGYTGLRKPDTLQRCLTGARALVSPTIGEASEHSLSL